MSGFAAQKLGDTTELEKLEPAWWALWRRCPSATPFQSPAWLIPWWRTFRPGPLFSFAVWRGSDLVGLAPFYLEDGALGRRLLPLGISLSDYLDVLIDPDDQDEVASALVSAASEAPDWERWELEDLREGAASLSLPLPRCWAEENAAQQPCPCLSLDPEDSLAQLPSRKRRNIRMSQNRAERRGPLAYDAGEPVDLLFRELVRLHTKNWARRGGTGLLASDTVLRFHDAALLALYDADLLRLRAIRINGAMAAVQYALQHRGTCYLYLQGFDPEFDFESPGTILLARVIEQAVAEGCHEIDFLRGGEPYKYTWGAADRWTVKRSLIRQ